MSIPPNNKATNNTPADKIISKTNNPLEERLIDLIAKRGPISISDYMSDALAHPHEGYYMTSSPIGEEGDFTTAPEISQVFGELIGLWLVQSWLDMGSPKAFNLVELGPGRGVLMADILRAARLRPEFVKAAQIYLVETSGRLRHEQQKRLRIHKEAKIMWADRFSDIAPAPTLIIANEFFDCLPINQFEYLKTGWHERLVGLNPEQDKLVLTHSAAPISGEKLSHPLVNSDNADLGDIIEISENSLKMTSQVAKFLVEHKGRALILDYGHFSSAFGDTFQAIRGHKFWPPLEAPGSADLTAHVDFQRLSETALHEGATVYGAISQGRFLDKLGLSYRVEALCRDKTQEQQNEIRRGAARIASPSQMGELFKALCIASPDIAPPAGFENINS